MPKSKIGSRLKDLRELVGFEKWEVAEYLDVDVETLEKFENNAEGLTTVSLNKLCVLYNCSPAYIVFWDKIGYDPLVMPYKSDGRIDLNFIAINNTARMYLKILRKVNSA